METYLAISACFLAACLLTILKIIRDVNSYAAAIDNYYKGRYDHLYKLYKSVDTELSLHRQFMRDYITKNPDKM